MKVLFLSFIVGLGVGVLYGTHPSKESGTADRRPYSASWGWCLASSSGLGFRPKKARRFACRHRYAWSVNATTVSFTILQHARRVNESSSIFAEHIAMTDENRYDRRT